MSKELMEGRASFPSLQGKHVFVTGGASGIGEALVEHFADQGAQVSFVDIDAAAAAKVIDKCVSRGNLAPVFVKVDLRDTAALEQCIADLGAAHGPIAVLLNNAGNDDRHKIDDLTQDYFDDRIAVNLRHQVFAAKAVAKQMRANGGGSIVNFSSINWMEDAGDGICYVTSKAAVVGMTRGLARELGKANIRVNAIAPGWVMTERQLALWVDEAGEASLDARQTLPGRVYPPDIARMALFLGAEDSRMIASQVFIVDGGFL